MKINALAHVSIIVSDMEKSIQFYRDILGLAVLLDKEISSPAFSKGVGLADAKARLVMLKLGEEETLVELFQYYQPQSPNVGFYTPNTVPLGHIAFSVENIDELYRDLLAKNCLFVSEPQVVLDGVKFCYVRDPDGALIEFIEFPKR